MKSKLFEIYPFNALKQAYKDYPEQLMELNLNTIYEVIDNIPQRQKYVLKLRFLHNYTLQRCAELIGITRERVRQLQDRTLKYLASEEVKIKAINIKKSDHDIIVSTKDKKYEDLAIAYERLKNQYKLISTTTIDQVIVTGLEEKAKILEAPIEDLGLSNRPYHRLKLLGKSRIKDICDMTSEEIKDTSNLGSKSQKEILDALSARGLQLNTCNK